MDKMADLPADAALQPEPLADALVTTSVRLVRWLKSADPAPQLTGAQASALAVIAHSGRIRPSDLARLEEVKRPTAARVIRELETRGLVARDRAEDDGRGAVLCATPAGKSLLVEGQARRCRPLARALAEASEDNRQALLAALAILQPMIERAIKLASDANGFAAA